MKRKVTTILKKITVMALVLAMVSSNLQVANAGTADAKADVKDGMLAAIEADQQARPEVTSLEITVDGVKKENNFTITKDNEVKIALKIDSKAVAVKEATVFLASHLDSAPYGNISLTYDEASNTYVGVVYAGYLADTEYYLEELRLTDENGKIYNYNLDDELAYFYVQNGAECEKPEHNIYVYLSSRTQSDEKGSYMIDEEVVRKTGIVTSWKDIFPEGMPELDAPEGSTFIGWYDGEKFIDYENDTFIANPEIVLYAVYDINYLMIEYYYLGTELWDELETQWVRWTDGMTYEDIMRQISPSFDFAEGLTLAGWKYENEGTDKIGTEGITWTAYAEARYNEDAVVLNTQYVSSEKGYCNDSELFVFEKGTTFGEFKKFVAERKLEHDSALTFVEWTDVFTEDNDVAEIKGVHFAQTVANYAEEFIPICINYSPEKHMWDDITKVYIPNGEVTYRDLLEYVESLNIQHASNVELIEWRCWDADETELDNVCTMRYPFSVDLEAQYEQTEWDSTVYTYVTDEYGNLSNKGYPVTTGKMTSWKEIFPEGLPTPEAPKGSKFIGWVYNGELVKWDDTLFEHQWDYVLTALFDINYANVTPYALDTEFPYFNSEVIRWTADDTYQDILDRLTLPTEHLAGLQFQKWDYSGFLNGHKLTDKVDAHELLVNGISIQAVYDKPVALLLFLYYDENMEQKGVQIPRIVEQGTTYGDVWALCDELGKDIKHNSKLSFEGWAEGWYGTEQEITGIGWMTIEGQYSEDLVDISLTYFGEDGKRYGKDVAMLYDETLTYRDVLEYAENYTIEHTKEKTFTGWELEQYDLYAPEIDLDSKLGDDRYVIVEAQYEPLPEVGTPLPPTVIEDKVDEIESAKDGETIEIPMKTDDGKVATQVPEEILEAAKGKDVDVVLDMGDYSWTINGEDITAEDLKDINLEVTQNTNVVDKGVVDKLAKGDKSMQISLTHNGEFGFKATLTLNLGKDNAGKFGNLYYYNDDKELVFQGAGKIDKDGNVSLGFDHASDYVIYIGSERTNIPEKGDNNALPFLVFAMGAMLVAAGVSKKRFAR